jgi:hypothetical protein
MHIQIIVVSLSVLLFSFSGPMYGQIRNPIPESIIKKGLSVEIREVTRLPDTSKIYPADQHRDGWARVNYVRELADGRRFANDTRGFLYLLDRDNHPSLYVDVGAAFPLTFYDGLAAGLMAFEFHPEFARNGLFYTSHIERALWNPSTPDTVPPGFTPADSNYHSVITEWRAFNPAANVYEGNRRELLRIGNAVLNAGHMMSHLEFNPTAVPGDPDYGLLYTSGTDFGFGNGDGPNAKNPGQTQRLDSIVGAILRIDPRSPTESGGTKGLGDYTIPPINKFAADGDPGTLGEIYAYGFRNAHRLSWDLTDGTMFASDIGEKHIEEINIIHEGNNYGWMQREGYFDNGINRPNGSLNQIFALPDEILNGQRLDEFTYPVVVYDHDDGDAVTGGFTYHGRIPELQGKFVFGDIKRGRLFVTDVAAMKDADDGVPTTVAPVEEVQIYIRDSSGNRTYVTFRELIEAKLGATVTRADMQISRSRDGEIFITSRQDGTIRILGPDSR